MKVEGVDAGAAIAAAGIPVFAQISSDDPVEEATAIEEAGAALIDFRHSGADAGARRRSPCRSPCSAGSAAGRGSTAGARAIHRLLGEPLAGTWTTSARAGR